MKPTAADLLGLGTGPRATWHLTEHRQIDLYDRRRKLVFAPAPQTTLAAHEAAAVVLQARHAQQALEAHLMADDALIGEGRSSWQRYLDLPRAHPGAKMTAEVYRMLRIVHIASAHAQGHVEYRDGLIDLSCTFGRCALTFTITEVGLQLLSSFVATLLTLHDSAYPQAWVDWLLAQTFTDVVAEVRRFADEDRILYQFQSRPFFNRHWRFDCENPRVKESGDDCVIEITRAHEDPRQFPIDFFAFVDDRLHIIPAEALRSGGRLPRAELGRWEARGEHGTLPAAWRGRFVRERMTVGLPMT